MPAVIALVILPFVVPPYQTVLLSYGLVFAIAALGFNLLLGYTGLLSFGHSAYFGVGAYAVAFVVKYLKVDSMEVLLLAGILGSAARGGAVRSAVCPLHEDLLRHPHPGAVPGPVEPRLQVLLGHRGLRRAPGADADPARRHGEDRRHRRPGQARLPLPPVLLLRARDLRHLRGPDVGHRPLAVRQGTAGRPRQRDAGGVRRGAGVALSLGGLPHLGHLHGAGGGALGAAQRAHHAGHPALDLLRQDRVLHRARGLSDVLRPHRRAR